MLGYPITPDGRYFVVRGRLWRSTDPSLTSARRDELIHGLMDARRDKGRAKRAGDALATEEARQRVDSAKRELGERGPVWWTDGAPDLDRHMVVNTPYRAWFNRLSV